HRAATHRAFQKATEFGVSLSRLGPVVRRSRFFFGRRANESELLDARNVVWIRPMQIGVRDFFLVKLDQHILAAGLIEKEFIFTLGAVAPKNVFWLDQKCDLMHPGKHSLISQFVLTDSVGS